MADRAWRGSQPVVVFAAAVLALAMPLAAADTFFHDRLVAVPTISDYIGRLQAAFGEGAAAWS